ncbi:hypothetical protein WMY93_031058 [Mugilogobius chulae]|uniref:L1 transposable element RRM domain-containing protein n=1 Tax=Mugilogobius chulae TaxID=88201 RepID=A0AAW0MIZ1_9GOBI
MEMHSYARAFDEQLDKMDKILSEVRGEDDKIPTALATLLSVVQNVEKMQVETLNKLTSLESSVNKNTCNIKTLSESMDAMGKQMEEICSETTSVQAKVNLLEKENLALRNKCDQLDAYSRRLNLRVSGVPEHAAEDVKKIVIDLFGLISPSIAHQLPLTVDVAHRLGPRSGDARSSRRIIVRFLSRSHRDRVWRDARTAAVLKEKKITLSEDLTQETREARNQLWPLVEKARSEGKKAGFRGAFAFIEGKKFTAKDPEPL